MAEVTTTDSMPEWPTKELVPHLPLDLRDRIGDHIEAIQSLARLIEDAAPDREDRHLRWAAMKIQDEAEALFEMLDPPEVSTKN